MLADCGRRSRRRAPTDRGLLPAAEWATVPPGKRSARAVRRCQLGVLGRQCGHPPTKLETDAVCTLDQTDAGFRITTMHLTVHGEVDGIDNEEFQAAAQTAKEGCPVSNALGGVEISFEASLG